MAIPGVGGLGHIKREELDTVNCRPSKSESNEGSSAHGGQAGLGLCSSSPGLKSEE